MDFKILVVLILGLGVIAGYTYSANTLDNGENDVESVYEEEMSLVVNSSNTDADIEFENNSIGLWYSEGEFFLDMDDDDSFESELSDNETGEGEFVRDVVRDGEAYQVYFRYNEGSDSEDSSLEVYRVRRI